MTERYTSTPQTLRRDIRFQLKKVEGRINRAIANTAVEAVKPIRRRAPKAFGELRDSVHSIRHGGPRTVVDAPHAAAVEIGSAPHNPNFEELLAWVKLRGMQGNRFTARQLARRGPTTLEQAVRVRSMFSEEVVRGPSGEFSPTDAPERVARRIAEGIRQHGTRPHWFVKESLGDIAGILDRNVRRAVKQ